MSLLLQETVENCDIVAEATTPRPLLSTDEPICRTGETACSDRCGALHPPFFFRPWPVWPRTKSLGCFVLLTMRLPTLPPICILGHVSFYNVTINSTTESCYPLHMSWSYWKIWYRGTLTQCRKNISGTFLENYLTIQNIFLSISSKQTIHVFWP